MINAIIIDDSPEALEFLKKRLEVTCPDVNIIGEAGNFEDGKALIRFTNADLLFLDIELGDHTGFDLLMESESDGLRIIFTTGHLGYSLKAIHFNAVHYLVKPIDDEELREAVDRVVKWQKLGANSSDQLNSTLGQIKNTNRKRLQVTSEKGTLFIDPSEVEFLKSDGSYTEIFLTNGELIVASKLLKEYEKNLSSDSFYRVSKSFIVNLLHVKMMNRKDGGTIEMLNGKEIQVPRRKRHEFLMRMTEFGG